MKTVIIYTDGACRGNPGPGGWGRLLSMVNQPKSFMEEKFLLPITGWS